MSNSWDPAEPTRFLCPWDFPGKNTGVGCHFLLQGIFPTQVSNPRLVHCRWILYHWATKEACFYNIILTTKGKAQWIIMALLFSANQPRRRADIIRAVSQMVSCQLNITSVFSTFSAVTGGARARLWGPYSPELGLPKRDTHLKGRKVGDCRGRQSHEELQTWHWQHMQAGSWEPPATGWDGLLQSPWHAPAQTFQW